MQVFDCKTMCALSYIYYGALRNVVCAITVYMYNKSNYKLNYVYYEYFFILKT